VGLGINFIDTVFASRIGRPMANRSRMHHITLGYDGLNEAIPIAAFDRYDAVITKQSSGAFREGTTCYHAVNLHKASLAEASP
jgi:hypothetical protein